MKNIEFYPPEAVGEIRAAQQGRVLKPDGVAMKVCAGYLRNGDGNGHLMPGPCKGVEVLMLGNFPRFTGDKPVDHALDEAIKAVCAKQRRCSVHEHAGRSGRAGLPCSGVIFDLRNHLDGRRRGSLDARSIARARRRKGKTKRDRKNRGGREII
jgi:hypothetical protein